ncbi:hypothetical protein [Shimia sagamensis]|uniref:Transmembrane protein (PGPGW) n=1 Tax=Shimia sagamensis TaxID=1566352 RepID=A0ABY1NLD1_9RHOB|nr:hypothetical protein [Shimia sagamensis]SMP12804.1 hypothetical protein SAMN06265373_102392 [Shimia sagamensis]
MRMLSDQTKRKIRRAKAWVRLKVPPGMRFLLGVTLMVFGVFGFLPVLGFWMLPLGVAVAAMDIKWIKSKLAKMFGR